MTETADQPTTVLQAEHELVRRMLAVLNGLAAEIADSPRFVREDLSEVLGFFRDFVGRLHHQKEAAVVYPLVAMSGDDADAAMVGELTADHDDSELLLRALTLDGERDQSDAEERAAFARLAQTYGDRLSRHMETEERTLFPLADALPGDDRIRLLEEFAQIEIGNGMPSVVWQRRVERLELRYVRAS